MMKKLNTLPKNWKVPKFQVPIVKVTKVKGTKFKVLKVKDTMKTILDKGSDEICDILMLVYKKNWTQVTLSQGEENLIKVY